jgi:hypothetical protein
MLSAYLYEEYVDWMGSEELRYSNIRICQTGYVKR